MTTRTLVKRVVTLDSSQALVNDSGETTYQVAKNSIDPPPVQCAGSYVLTVTWRSTDDYPIIATNATPAEVEAGAQAWLADPHSSNPWNADGIALSE